MYSLYTSIEIESAAELRHLRHALKFPVLIMLGLFGLAGFAVPANGASWESLIMPGPVIEGHADLEDECTSCHTPFSGEEQNELCLDCHEDVASDLALLRGFHGTHPTVAMTDCSQCHSEHLGRDADVTGLVPESFDHGLTDFALIGAHAIQACDTCHKPDTRHREASSLCIDCHETDDTHNGGLGAECEQCHEPTNWASTQFDHEAQTEYALIGAHDQQHLQLDLPPFLPQRDVRCAILNNDKNFTGINFKLFP